MQQRVVGAAGLAAGPVSDFCHYCCDKGCANAPPAGQGAVVMAMIVVTFVMCVSVRMVMLMACVAVCLCFVNGFAQAKA